MSKKGWPYKAKYDSPTSEHQESPMQYFPRLKLSPSDIRFHAGVGPADSELYAEFISEKEVSALISAARAQGLRDAKDRINEMIEKGKRMNAFSASHIDGMLQAWGLVHELDEYLAKKAREGREPEGGKV